MKITDVRTVLLTGPCTKDRFVLEARKVRSAAFIEIHTAAGGPVGIGETYAGYFCPELVPHIVEFFKPILVGLDLGEIDDADELWQRMYFCSNFWSRVGLGVAVINGIDAALWDLKGKLERQPVHKLLGGAKHAKLPCYATGSGSNYPKEKLAEKIDYYLGLGFRAFKLGAGCLKDGKEWQPTGGPDAVADFEQDKVKFIRQHVGADVKILLDGHMGNSPAGTWDYETALRVLQALEPYDLFFFEEPLPYSDPKAYSDLARSTTVPVAGGEVLTALSEWRVFAENDSFDIAQPDASFTGGIREFLRVAELFAARGKKIATHSWGAGGSLMQNVHCGFAAINTCILEVAPDFAELHTEIMGDSFQMRDGHVLPPDCEGLGIRLDERTKRRYPFVAGTGEFNSVPGKILNT